MFDFEGLKTATTTFFHASFGKLSQLLGNNYDNLIEIKHLDQQDWELKYNEALELARSPKQQAAVQNALAELS